MLTICHESNLILNSSKTRHFVFLSCYFVLRKSKEEYDEEMSRRLLLEEEVGSTSSSCSDKPMAKSSEAQKTTSPPRQQSNTAKVRRHELYEPNKTCGPAEPQLHMNPVRFFVQAPPARNLWNERCGRICKTCSITVLLLSPITTQTFCM